MPFNYLACSIKGTAFSEYSSLLLITREMNSSPGGVSLPKVNPLPKHILHLRPPSNPLPVPQTQLSSLRLRAPREPPERSRGQLAPPRRLLPCARPLAAPHSGPGPPTCWLGPEPHPPASELPPLAALSALVTGPEVGVEESLLGEKTGVCKAALALGWSWGIRSRGREGAAVRFPDF